jgi:hypothetical protein
VTASELLAALREIGCDPDTDAGELVLAADPPDALAVRLEVLRTGVLAVLAGKRWYGCDPATGRTAALDPTGLIPPAVGLLAVGGSNVWERLHPVARLDLPELFIAAGVVKPKPKPAPTFDPAADAR